MEVVLIHPGSRSQVYQALGETLAAIEPPVWAGLMATYLRRKGVSVEIIDAEAQMLTPEEVAERVEPIRPRLVAVVVYGHQPSASTQNMPAAGATCRALKARLPEQPLLLVGGHVAALPERTLEEEAVDFTCSGEGPVTLWALLNALREKGDLAQVPGLVYRSAGGIQVNRPAPLVRQLDAEMPGVAWDLLPMDRYRAHNWHCLDGLRRQPYAALYTTLGCPYHCSFCCIQAPFKSGEHLAGLKESINSYRFWSPETVLAQLETLVRDYGVRNVKFADEMFVLHPKHVLAICDGIIARGFDLNIWAYARVDTVREEMIDKLKRAGFNWLAFGIEAANAKVRDDVHKGFGEELIFKTLEKVRRAGIHVIGNYIFGLPEDDHTTMRQTLNLALTLNCEFSNFYCFVPGTPIYTPGGITPIENVLVGQEVLGAGGATKVTDRSERYYEGMVLEVKPRYLPSVTVTPEHPFLVARLQRNRQNKAKVKGIAWKQAKELTRFNDENPQLAYDAVVLPRRTFRQEETVVDFSPFVKGHVGGGKLGGQLNGNRTRFLQPWRITEDLAELFGWYVAEGSRLSRVNHQIGFSLCSEERAHIDRVRRLVYNCFGYRTRVLPKEGKSIVVTLTSKVLSRALPALFGEEAHDKRIPAFLLNARAEIAKAFLKGYAAGDGTSHPNSLGQYSVTSCSDDLIRQAMVLFIKTGTLPSYGAWEAPERTLRGRSLNAAPYFRLSWVQDPQYEHYLVDDENYYIPIKSVRQRSYQGMVYNFSTENETYAVPFIVHNCAMAYPGSALYQTALKEGWPLPQRWSGYSQHSVDTLPLPTRHLPAAEVLRFRDNAFNIYYSHPNYLELVRRKFGPATVEHIRQMASHQLERIYAK